MRISLRWLKSYLNFDLPVDELLDTITMAGLEVEEEIDLGMRSGKLVIGRVLETAPHPQADKLTLCKVDAGAGEPLSIVCGAPNVRPGMVVPCALIGATLPNGLTLEPRKIRGQASEGMLCAADEIEMGADHAGIMELPADWPVGERFDMLAEIKVTPNRPDCLNVLGVAREVAAMHGRKVFPPKPRLRETLSRIEGMVKLSVAAKAQCPRYTCRLIRGAKIGESPLWMKRRLEASGLRSINNVVDVTNYVLLELGHPLHAFDYKKLAGGEIRVRLAEPGERMKIIDGRELELTGEDLLIADAAGGVALAGVMGGLESEVTADTTDILLEAAYFDPVTIRRTSKRHGISTDSSYRFERGTDREGMVLALNRAAQLINELAGGEVVRGFLDVQTPPPDRQPIVLEVARVNDLLGLELSGTQIADYLVNLGFEVRGSGPHALIVQAPSHRVDIFRDVDLIEEVARLHNYNNIPSTLPRTRLVPDAPSRLEVLVEAMRDGLAELGFSESMSYSFISESQAAAVGFDPARQPHVANPLTVDQAIMRPSLLPGLVRAVGYNQNQDEPTVALFEIGKVWRPGAVAADPAGERPEAALVLAGPGPAHWSGTRAFDFYDIKGGVESLAAGWGVTVTFEPLTDSPVFHPGRSAWVKIGERAVGEVGELHPDLAAGEDLRGRVYAARLELDVIGELAGAGAARMKGIPRLPATWRDLALVVDRDLAAGKLLEAARRAGGALAEEAVIFDVYEGEHVEPGKKSIGLSLRLRSHEKTLTEEEIRAVMEKVTRSLGKQFGATLRG